MAKKKASAEALREKTYKPSNGLNDIDIEKIKFHKFNLDWSVELLDEIDMLRLTGNKESWAKADLTNEILSISKKLPRAWHLWTFFDQYFKVCFYIIAGSQDHYNGTIDNELGPSLIAEGMCDLINKGIIRFSNGEKLNKIRFDLNLIPWKVLFKDSDEIADKRTEDTRACTVLVDGELWLNSDYKPKTRVMDFFHEFCHVCLAPMRISNTNDDGNSMEAEVMRGLVAKGIMELLKQGVIEFNDEYIKR